MSGDPEQDYFVDGLVEDILTGLARVKLLTVIARNSSFVYKGKAVDIRQVGRELGASYVLEGSVRKGGSRLRITAQLIEADTGAHLWADRFDGALDDVFELQDQITECIVAIIEPSVLKSEIERSRRKRPENLAAYDLCLRALPHLYLPILDGAKTAAPLLEDALRLDPNFPRRMLGSRAATKSSLFTEVSIPPIGTPGSPTPTPLSRAIQTTRLRSQ